LPRPGPTQPPWVEVQQQDQVRSNGSSNPHSWHVLSW
jgi:hypothetical protein